MALVLLSNINRKGKAPVVPPESSRRTPRPRGAVLVVCPGGLEHGGGIGRQMGYFLRARDGSGGLDYRLIDSRGPWFLGASRLHVGLAGFYLAAAAAKLVAARLAAAPCIAHINITGRGSTIRKVILATVARAVGLRYLLHVHDYDYAAEYERRGAMMKSMIARVFRGAERVLVLGAREQDALSRLLALTPHRVAVLHNAVPDPQPGPARRGNPDAPCHLVFLGHLSARKGVPELLQALARPDVASLRWKATLAGGGPIDEYRGLAAELGIADRIAFPGWLDQAGVRQLCEAGDVLVLPSHAEGLAMAMLEGLSYGLAVVTTPVGAHAEVIEPGVSGILVPPGDVTALAAALAQVVADGGLRERLSAGARRRFLDKFEVGGYAERLGRLHAALLWDRDAAAIEPAAPIPSPGIGGESA